MTPWLLSEVKKLPGWAASMASGLWKNSRPGSGCLSNTNPGITPSKWLARPPPVPSKALKNSTPLVAIWPDVVILRRNPRRHFGHPTTFRGCQTPTCSSLERKLCRELELPRIEGCPRRPERSGRERIEILPCYTPAPLREHVL
jgi:hypothetical protein